MEKINKEMADKATNLLSQGKMTEAIEAVNGPSDHTESSKLDIFYSDDFSAISMSNEIDKECDRIKRQRLSDVRENKPVGPGGNIC